MSVSPIHSQSHALPVQPTPPVRPVKAKPAEHVEESKPKAATPPHVGKKLDIHA